MRWLVIAAAATVAILVSGCTNDAGGQSMAHSGNLAYNGATPGTHHTTLDCGSEGTFTWIGNLGSGQVDIRVLDGDDVQKFSIIYSKVGQSSDSKPVFGAAGEWTLTATRESSGVGGWNGQYDAHLEC